MLRIRQRLVTAALVAASWLAFRRWRPRSKRARGAQDLRRTIGDHERWVASGGRDGARADLEGRDLHDAVLTNANLSRASLAHADFTGADLSGASLRQANLRGADLTNAKGLSAAQLSGADLASAKLPAAIAGFDGLAQVANLSKNAARTFAFLAFACLYSCVTVAMTTDARLLTRFVSSPLPVIQAAIPLFLFYIVAPFIITAIYLYLHLQLQGLWEEIAALPAVFPDGRTLSSKVHPWLLTSLAQRFGSEHGGHPASRLLEMAIAWLSAWAVGPITLLIFWLRYLPRHDGVGSSIQVALLALSTVVGTWSHQRAFAFLSHEEPRATTAIPAALGVAIALAGAILSYGAIAGIDTKAENQRTPVRLTAPDSWLRTAVPSLLAKLGLRAFADMKDAAVSDRPSTWTSTKSPGVMPLTGDRAKSDEAVSDDIVRSVVGANLTGKRLRYANARGAFLVRADLSGAKLRGADLSFALMQRAVLEQTELALAYMARTQLVDADLKSADLRDAYLGGAHLEDADLRDADLTGALLVATHLEGSHLNFARLDGAMLSGADLKDAKLGWTSLCGANLGWAKNLTQEQLAYAFTDAATVLPNGLKPGLPCARSTPLTVQRGCAIAGGTPPELHGGKYKIVLRSDANTCALTTWPPGELGSDVMLQLDRAPPPSIPFGSAVVGRFFTWTPVPEGAPKGTEVINIPPGDGRSGYFKWTFVAPRAFSSVHLAGRANADDAGRVFLNGTPISPSIFSPAAIREFDGVKFSTDNAALFRRGAVNEIVLSDTNTGAGPSGAAFYVELTFRK